MSNDPEIIVLPHKALGGLLAKATGHGIFIDCDRYRMNVGAILPLPDGTYMLNVTITAEMEIPGYEPCDLTAFHNTSEEALGAARAFLESHRRQGR